MNAHVRANEAIADYEATGPEVVRIREHGSDLKLKRGVDTFLREVGEIHRLRATSPDDVRVSGKDISIPPKYFMVLHELMCRLEEGSSAMNNSQFMIHTFLVVRTIVFGEVDTQTSYKDMLNGWEDKKGFLAGAYELMSKTQNLRKLTMEDRLKVLQGAVLLWSSKLKAKEFRAMIGLLVRALYCGDLTVRTSSRTLCEGNEFYATIMGRAQFYESLVSLEAEGAIARHTIHVRRSDHLTINLGWCKPHNPQFNGLNLTCDALKKATKGLCDKGYYRRTETGKGAFSIRRMVENGFSFSGLYRTEEGVSASIVDSKVTNSSPIDQEYQAEDHSPTARITAKNVDFEEREKSEEREAHPSSRLTSEKLQIDLETDPKIKSARTQLRASSVLRKAKPNSKDFMAVWKNAMRETFPGMATSEPTKRLRGAIMQAIKRYPTGQRSTYLEVVDWSVRNWAQVIHRKFGFTNGDAPASPAIQWFISEGVFTIFANSHATGELSKLKQETEDDVQRLMLKGMNREEALLQIAEQKARSGLKKEIAQGKQKADRALAEAKDRENNAKRLDDMKEMLASMPEDTAGLINPDRGEWAIPHPDSKVMKEYRARVRQTQEKPTEIVNVVPDDHRPMKSWEEIQRDNASASSHSVIRNRNKGSRGSSGDIFQLASSNTPIEMEDAQPT